MKVTVLVVLTVLVLTGCSTTAPAHGPADPPPADELGLPPVQGALEFPPGATEVTHGWLVDELARLTGQELSLSPTLRSQLDLTRERLELTTPVPEEEVYAYVEALLARYVLMAPMKGGEHPVLGLHAWSEDMNREPAPKAIAIDVEQRALLERHPALCFQLVITFQNIDSRQLQTQLRQLLADNSGFTLTVPAGDRSLLLQGSGAKLASLTEILLEVDRASAARPVPEPAAPAPPR